MQGVRFCAVYRQGTSPSKVGYARMTQPRRGSPTGFQVQASSGAKTVTSAVPLRASGTSGELGTKMVAKGTSGFPSSSFGCVSPGNFHVTQPKQLT